jgi:hypothetical protein
MKTSNRCTPSAYNRKVQFRQGDDLKTREGEFTLWLTAIHRIRILLEKAA